MTTSFTERVLACATIAALIIAVLTLAGCSGGDGPVVPPIATETTCNGVATSVRSLAPFESVVLSGASVACFALAGGDREYLVVPQLTGASLPYGGYGFRLGDPNPTVTARTGDARDTPDAASLSAQQLFGDHAHSLDAQAQLDARMRERERVWSASAVRATARPPQPSWKAATNWCWRDRQSARTVCS